MRKTNLSLIFFAFISFSAIFINAAELNLLFRMIGGESGVAYYHHGQGSHPVPVTDRPQLTIEYAHSGQDKTLILRHGVNGYTSGKGTTIMSQYPDENLVDPPDSNPGGSAPAKEGYIKAKWDTKRRGLVQFDLSAIPRDAQIKTARLWLRTEAKEGYGSGTTGILYVYLLNECFTIDEVTWNNRMAGIPWTVKGGLSGEKLFEFPMRGNPNIAGTKPGTHTMTELAQGVTKALTQNLQIQTVRAISSEQLTLKVYPNPFSHSLLINFHGAYPSMGNIEKAVRIFDLKGDCVKKFYIPGVWNSNYMLKEFNSLPSGNYIIKIQSCNRILTAKIHKIK